MADRQIVPGQTQRLVQGALILTVGALVSRVLGAFYKPIVTWLFAPYDGQDGLAGLGLTQVAYAVYLTLLSVSAIGFNIAISRLVAERLARNRVEAAKRVFRVALALMAGAGFVVALLFYAAADLLAQIANRPETAGGFRAIAPAIFVVAVMAAFRGLFQGQQEMTPYAVSQVLEQVVRIVTGILLVWWLAPQSVALGAAGYNFGAVTGGLAALVLLLWVYWQRGGQLRVPPDLGPGLQPGPEQPERIRDIVIQVLKLAAPISVIGAVLPLLQTADSMIVLGRLESIGLEKGTADGLFGALAGSYSLVHLPPVLTEALYISLIPAVTEALTLGNVELARQRAITALRLTMIFALPAVVGLWTLSDGIYGFIFRTTAGGAVLRSLALMTLTLMLVQTTSGILQGAGNVMVPVRNYLIAFAAKIGLTWWWAGLPALGIHGAAWASVVAFGLATTLNFVALRRRMGPLVDFVGMWLKPGFSAAAMGLLVWWLHPLLAAATSGRVATLVAILLGGTIYTALMIALGGLSGRDFELIPRIGPRIAAWLQRRGLLRD